MDTNLSVRVSVREIAWIKENVKRQIRDKSNDTSSKKTTLGEIKREIKFEHKETNQGIKRESKQDNTICALQTTFKRWGEATTERNYCQHVAFSKLSQSIRIPHNLV